MLTRRGIFGAAAGAAIGGKQVFKAAAGGAISLGQARAGVEKSLDGFPPLSGPSKAVLGSNDWASRQLAKLANPKHLQLLWDQTEVQSLDLDLVCQESRSLSARYAEQKRRNFERRLSGEKTYFERMISGFFED